MPQLNNETTYETRPSVSYGFIMNNIMSYSYIQCAVSKEDDERVNTVKMYIKFLLLMGTMMTGILIAILRARMKKKSISTKNKDQVSQVKAQVGQGQNQELDNNRQTKDTNPPIDCHSFLCYGNYGPGGGD